MCFLAETHIESRNDMSWRTLSFIWRTNDATRSRRSKASIVFKHFASRCYGFAYITLHTCSRNGWLKKEKKEVHRNGFHR